MDRRTLLKSGLAWSLGSSALFHRASFAASLSDHTTPQAARFLLIFLRGGYDACHLLVPTSSDFYYEARPNIAIARPTPNSTLSTDAGSSTSVSASAPALPLNADWGLHPALAASLYPLYTSGELAFIPFAGTDDLSRSHFETQDSIELGQALSPSVGAENQRDFHSGFLNRLAQQLSGQAHANGFASMSFTDQLPLIAQGKANIANTALRSNGKSRLNDRQSELITQMYRQTTLAQQVNEGFAIRAEVARDLQQEMLAADRNAISSKGFELEASRIARMMREKYALGFVDIGGWDTHVNQGAANGFLANKFEELGRGLLAYRKEMGAAWRNTTVVVISEFGRTFRENGKRGTDHGHGSVYWVLGGGIRGGKIAGEQIALRADTLFQQRDYPVLNEYRAVLAGLFARNFGLNQGQLAQVFPGVQARDLQLI